MLQPILYSPLGSPLHDHALFQPNANWPQRSPRRAIFESANRAAVSTAQPTSQVYYQEMRGMRRLRWNQLLGTSITRPAVAVMALLTFGKACSKGGHRRIPAGEPMPGPLDRTAIVRNDSFQCACSGLHRHP
jgi:hypothetical protein